MKIRLLLSYKGTHFFGWQRQKNKRSVQGDLEQALFKLFKKKISVIGSGRTDAGVHALGQTAHFEITQSQLKNKNILVAINHFLPKDLSVLKAYLAPDTFHARFSCIKKTYYYFIWTGLSKPALLYDFICWKKQDLCLKTLQKLSDVIIGTHNFKSFQTSGSSVKNSIKTITQSEWRLVSPQIYRYKIQGSGFLKQMVRNLVGTYLDLLKEPQAVTKMLAILKSQDRRQALGTAPGKGLYLKKAFYPCSIDKQCKKI